MAWLLDTNVMSELRRPRPDSNVVAFVSAQPLNEIFVSVVTMAELRFGIERVTEPERRTALHEWLTSVVRPMFDGRVLPITEEIMLRWRLLVEEGRKSGHTYSQPDLIIAATAVQNGLTIVTRDRREYDRAGVAVVNPWEFWRQ